MPDLNDLLLEAMNARGMGGPAPDISSQFDMPRGLPRQPDPNQLTQAVNGIRNPEELAKLERLRVLANTIGGVRETIQDPNTSPVHKAYAPWLQSQGRDYVPPNPTLGYQRMGQRINEKTDNIAQLLNEARAAGGRMERVASINPSNPRAMVRREKSQFYDRVLDPGLGRGVPQQAVEPEPVGPNERQQALIAALAQRNAGRAQQIAARTPEQVAAQTKELGEQRARSTELRETAQGKQHVRNMKSARRRGVLKPSAYVSGVDEGIFPDKSLQRAQIMAMLMRARQAPQRVNPQEEAIAELIRQRTAAQGGQTEQPAANGTPGVPSVKNLPRGGRVKYTPPPQGAVGGRPNSGWFLDPNGVDRNGLPTEMIAPNGDRLVRDPRTGGWMPAGTAGAAVGQAIGF